MSIKMYTIPKVAKMLGVTPFAVRSWLRAGKIKGVKIPDNSPKSQWFVSEEEIARLTGDNNKND